MSRSSSRATQDEPGRRRGLLKWAFAALMVCALVLDAFSYGTELGDEFVGWDLNVLELGKQTDLDALQRDMDRVNSSAPAP